MTHIFQHPKYYKELRSIRNKLDQAISEQASTEVSSVRPDPGLKQQAQRASSRKRQASSPNQQASSFKPQATSSLIFKPS